MSNEAADMAKLRQLVTRAPAEQILTWQMHPAPGGMLSAEVVGGALKALDELLCCIANREGYQHNVGIVSIKTDDNFGVECKLLITRLEIE